MMNFVIQSTITNSTVFPWRDLVMGPTQSMDMSSHGYLDGLVAPIGGVNVDVGALDALQTAHCWT